MTIKTKCELFTHQEKTDELENPGVRINRFLLYIRVSQKIQNFEKYIAHTIKSCLLMANGHYQNSITIEIDLVVSQDKSSFV